jgi:hypothetical protein
LQGDDLFGMVDDLLFQLALRHHPWQVQQGMFARFASAGGDDGRAVCNLTILDMAIGVIDAQTA